VTTIGIDYTAAIEQGAGIGRYVRGLTNALAHSGSPYEYRLFVAGAKKEYLPAAPSDAFSFHSTRLTPRWLYRIWHRMHIPLPISALVGRVDLYHATDFVLPPLGSIQRSLLTVHDLSFIRVPETSPAPLREYLSRVVPDSARRATHILADSHATKEDMVGLWRIPADKISVLWTGVEAVFTPVLAYNQLTMRSELGISGDRPFLLSVGTVQPRKNYERCVEALYRLRSNGHDVDYVIAGGTGWLSDELFAMIERLDLSAHVKLIGHVPDQLLPALYSAASVLLYPSLYEGFGYPVLESMACGTPVVTSNVSSMPEVAGNAAIQVDPYVVDEIVGAVDRLLRDQYFRSQVIVRGLEQAARFTWAGTAEKLLTIYDAMLNDQI
jgi:glycosyltransferase involved in cell wall biosynthesis